MNIFSGQKSRAHIGDELIVEANDIHKYYGNLHVLKGISMKVHEGEVVVIVGPSGSGKSTFLRCINHLEKLNSGEIIICGHLVGYRQNQKGKIIELSDKDVSIQRRDVGMVFQQFNLFPHLNVIENITISPINVLKINRQEATFEALRLLKLVGLPEKANMYPGQLSGGQQQRVAIARALAMKPKLMLFDEATSALDPEMITEVLDVMIELSHEGMTMLVVTHEMGFARAAADRVVFFEDGIIVEENDPNSFFNNPATDRAQKFLAKIL
jgi:ABC-type polar amino acid transport system ATPase subunit